MQAADICQPRQQPQPQVFGKETQARLKKRSSNKSDEEKWIGIYQTLFPDDTSIPLPYHDELPLAEYRECAQYELPSRLKGALGKLSSPITNSPLLSEPVLMEIIKIVCACNDDLVQEFQYDQQRESAQDRSADLTTTNPHATPESTPEAFSDAGLPNSPQYMRSSWNPHQTTFPDPTLRSIAEPQAPINNTMGINYDDQLGAITTIPDLMVANAGEHQSTEYWAWWPSEGSSEAAQAVFPSTDPQFMPMLPRSPENLVPAWNNYQPSAPITMDDADFVTDMYAGTDPPLGHAFPL
ncbi:hypothetical protein SLS55_009988 [Diplodia seriata]|uniref:Uncharacterized protein n=1 Tax=Diplodia seriata TaxID=420778 RepID=A0ABR3C1N5_9PEZI